MVAFLAALSFLPGAPHPPPPAPPPAVAYGTITVCATAGSRPVAGPLLFSLAAPASQGGTQTVSIAVGACSAQIFYPSGTSLNVVENVPAGAAVTAIALTGQGTLTASAATAGSATVTIATGSGTLTFATSGPAATVAFADCKVPNVVGLGVLAAKSVIRKHSCTVGLVRRKYSSAFRAGHVTTESPRRGAVLAHGAPVDIVVSRGPRP
jgi:hypothetical protein